MISSRRRTCSLQARPSHRVTIPNLVAVDQSKQEYVEVAKICRTPRLTVSFPAEVGRSRSNVNTQIVIRERNERNYGDQP